MTIVSKVTLEQLLASRDNRRLRQQELLSEWCGKTLVCLTVIMPGSEKRNATSLIIAHEACVALLRLFKSSVLFSEERDLVTGYELYLVVDRPIMKVKEAVCDIEDRHPLGRLFDIDVITPAGEPLSRQSVGREPRRCLICGKEARYCMRNRSHTTEELIVRINDIVET